MHALITHILICSIPPGLALAAHQSTRTIYFSIIQDTHTCYSKRNSYLYTSTLNNTHENVQSTYVPQGSLRQCPIMSHMYSFLCLHSVQTLVFCRCMHAEYNTNCLENPLGPASGCAMLLTGYYTHTKVKKERHRKSEFGSSI